MWWAWAEFTALSLVPDMANPDTAGIWRLNLSEPLSLSREKEQMNNQASPMREVLRFLLYKAERFSYWSTNQWWGWDLFQTV